MGKQSADRPLCAVGQCNRLVTRSPEALEPCPHIGKWRQAQVSLKQRALGGRIERAMQLRSYIAQRLRRALVEVHIAMHEGPAEGELELFLAPQLRGGRRVGAKERPECTGDASRVYDRAIDIKRNYPTV